ncbi:lysine-specific demethylase 8 [Hetaerina americana]|uniref:lysine-specific demethylase 8 n=1 Tax=Hetaerina americana TaxID=62018 RepID=UPI003A7F5A40
MDNLNRLRELLVDEKGTLKYGDFGVLGIDSKDVEGLSGELYLLKRAGDQSLNISESHDKELVIRRLKNGLKNNQAVLDSLWEKLNTGIWKDTPIYLRCLFSHASLVKAFILLSISVYHGEIKDPKCSLEYTRAALKSVDLGILLGMPTPDLTTAAQIILQVLNMLASRKESGGLCVDRPHKKIKMDSLEISDSPQHPNVAEIGETTSITHSLMERPWREWGKPRTVPVLFRPSLEQFYAEHYLRRLPAILQGCLDHWPALSSWSPSYLAKVAGNRTVPVELGPNYVHPTWGQKLMAVGEFVEQHMVPPEDAPPHEGIDKPIGYLAQHPLFEQVPELRNDIKIPEYCCLSEESDSATDAEVEPDINAWFGPKGTVSPLHYDPKHNLLAQVVGTKRVILYSSDDSEYLHPYEGQMLSNTSQVDPEDPKILEKFPDVSSAQAWECEIRAGDMLYIPRCWWHHVRSLSTSFSVSFWW